MIRKIVILIWLCAVAASILAYLIWPDHFSPQSVAASLLKFQSEALVCYLIVSILRGFTLLPSTPLIIAGTLVFPGQPGMVLTISIFGILVSSTMIYWFSDLLGISNYFEQRKPKSVIRIRGRLEQPAGFLFVMLWAFFPLIPTDAVCYVAGSTRMNFVKFIAAIFIGELMLCSFYVFSGSLIFNSIGH